ncbi:MAG: trehalose 2-sulfotransferase [Sphingomonadales bacterium]|jgi:LPS sulfotransferase NodH|nr:trehalose 2-sulfotransferase [Sphingomonadales bacterium]
MPDDFISSPAASRRRGRIACFDTGYEAEFDFPSREDPPSLRYMLAAVPRTGSTFLAHLLWRTGCLGAPLEYLDFASEGHQGHLCSSPEAQIESWRVALATRTSPNGVFGFKAFLMQLRELAERNEALLDMLQPSEIVYIMRRDRVAHSVSYARAHLTGIWCHEQSNGANEEVDYSIEALRRAESWIEAQEEQWERLFEKLGVAPLRLWYEDAVARPHEAVEAVARHLGIILDPAASVEVPAVRKQAGDAAGRWARAYARDRVAAAQAGSGA